MNAGMTSGMKFIGVMWENMRRDSWDGMNHAMWSAVSTAVGSGLEFSKEDFDSGFGDYGKRWNGGCDFRTVLYQIAVQSDNIKVAKAMEQSDGIGPFMANDVDLGYKHGAVMLHLVGNRARSRLVVGARVSFDKRMWYVTAMDKDFVRFAAYKTGYRSGKPEKLCKLSREELAKFFPAPKKAK